MKEITPAIELAMLRQVAEIAKCEYCGCYFPRFKLGTKKRFCTKYHRIASKLACAAMAEEKAK